MEISKGLQQEIQLVQSKLKNAIRDHQICVGKLKDDPNNADILGRIQEIQLHIVSLGRCQKQVVQRLRKEVESFKADNSKDVKVSFASLLGLNNNNNHITANNEATTEEISEAKVVTNGLGGGRYPKEDYEEIVRNGDAATPPRDNLRNKERSVSVETLSAEDEITEVEVEVNSLETRHQDSEERLNERKVNSTEQLDFLEMLGLITSSRFTDLQNKRAERKRRSTANPQFVYSTWEIPTKRKRYNYLQSAGNVPQTRQTTARLNGPSPPPGTNSKSAPGVAPPKSTSPPTRTIAKSLIPTQKATTRPNILRNMSESRLFVSKARSENGNEPVQLSSSTKSSQQSNNSKTVHIPGLPSGLTIERIESDSAVCINCRNPGTLTNCDNCEANYHVSCHTVTPPPPRLCPKCALRLKDGVASTTTTTTKKNEELVAASYAPGVAGKAGEDPEIDKTSCGLYKIGTASRRQRQQQQQQQQQHRKRQLIVADRAIDELRSATLLVPIAASAVAAVNSVDRSVIAVDDRSIEIAEPDIDGNPTGDADGNNVSYSTSLVISNQYSRSSVTYVPQPESGLSYDYQLSRNGTEDKRQSYFIVEKIGESGKRSDEATKEKAKRLSTAPALAGTRQGRRGGGERRLDDGILRPVKLAGRLDGPFARGSCKSATRAVPGLNRIVDADGRPIALASEHANDNDMDKQSGGSCGVRDTTIADRRSSVATGAPERLGRSGELAEASNDIEPRRPTGRTRGNLLVHDKRMPKPDSPLDAVFAGNNESDNVVDDTDGTDRPEGHSAAANHNENDSSDEPDVDTTRGQSERRPHRSELARSAEDVKLEEAHISAPLRAKLVIDDVTTFVSCRRSVGGVQTAAGPLSSRRRTTEDRGTPTLRGGPRHASNDDGSNHERTRQLPRILMRHARASHDTRDSENDDTEAKKNSNLARKYRKSGTKTISGTALPERADSSSDTSSTETGDEGSSPLGEPDRIVDGEMDEYGNEDIESKDLVTEVRDVNEIVVDSDEELDEEVDDDDEEEEEDDLEDSPILDEDIGVRTINNRCGMNNVSTESMRVLEQFESAILDADSADTTADS